MVDDVVLEQANEFIYHGYAYTKDESYTAVVKQEYVQGTKWKVL